MGGVICTKFAYSKTIVFIVEIFISPYYDVGSDRVKLNFSKSVVPRLKKYFLKFFTNRPYDLCAHILVV